jgi:hypothetical protein
VPPLLPDEIKGLSGAGRPSSLTPLSGLGQLCQGSAAGVVLLEAPGFVDHTLEDAPDGTRLERRSGGRGQSFEHATLALRVVHREPVPRLVLADRQDETHALADQLEELRVHGVDGTPQCFEIGLAHGRGY